VSTSGVSWVGASGASAGVDEDGSKCLGT
jgi:hypothetical protein